MVRRRRRRTRRVGHRAGIAAADIPRIFDRFYRAAAARQADGAGLGLSIARWIADQHGARIDVASAVGRGTTSTVRFPPPGR